MSRIAGFFSFSCFCCLLLSLCISSLAQELTLKPTVRVELDSSVGVKSGAVVRAHTIETLYTANQLVLPTGTLITGKIIKVSAVSRRVRLSAMSHGDFTPLRNATIQFDELNLRSGLELPIVTAPASQNNAVMHFGRSAKSHQSIFHRVWTDFVGQGHQALSVVAAPGKAERLKKIAYGQLPWHPQSLSQGTEYDISFLRIPDDLQSDDLQPDDFAVSASSKRTASRMREGAILHARLATPLDSKNAKRDDAVAAVVTEPLLDSSGKVEVPQGAVLRGRVLRAKKAKMWGRKGALRFTFNRLDFPAGFQQEVLGVPAGVDAAQNRSLKLDSEGGVEPDSNKGLMAPLALGLLATSSFADEDASLLGSATASNGFGLLTRIVSVASDSKTFAGVVGMTAAARTVYVRFIARGENVEFPRNSEIEVDAGPLNKHLLPRSQR